MDEWKILSHLYLAKNIQVIDLDMLGHCDFDAKYNWEHNDIPLHLQETTMKFVEVNHSCTQTQHIPYPNPHSDCSFSPTQSITFNTIISHFTKIEPATPFKMVQMV